MSRSGYSDDCDGWELIMWRGAVASAIRGKRGQAFLKEMLSVLDEMPSKRLIERDLEAGGEVCALGSVGAKRGIDMSGIDPYDRKGIASVFAIPPALASEIMHVNDDWYWRATPEQRWQLVRDWVAGKISPAAPNAGNAA